MGEYAIIDQLCQVSNQLLEIVTRQAEVIAQADIPDDLKQSLATAREAASTEMNLIEYRLRHIR